jgi:hypothetical protein
MPPDGCRQLSVFALGSAVRSEMSSPGGERGDVRELELLRVLQRVDDRERGARLLAEDEPAVQLIIERDRRDDPELVGDREPLRRSVDTDHLPADRPDPDLSRCPRRRRAGSRASPARSS